MAHPVVLDSEGNLQQLQTDAPLTVEPPSEDSHAATLESVQVLIEENLTSESP